MTKKSPNENNDDLSSALHKALIECGAVIPTTPEMVLLAETQHDAEVSPAEVDAAFRRLESTLNDPIVDLSFIKMNDTLLTTEPEDLAMAARNGTELDEITRAKIEESVQKALRKPPQDPQK